MLDPAPLRESPKQPMPASPSGAATTPAPDVAAWLEALGRLTGLRFRLAGRHGPVVNGSEAFCRLWWQATSGQQAAQPEGCRAAHGAIHRAAGEAGRPVTRRCHGGMWLSAAPVVGGAGGSDWIECGPYRGEPSTEGHFSAGVSGTPHAALELAREKLPVVEGSEREAVARLLSFLAQGMAGLRAGAAPRARENEAAPVARARRIVGERLDEGRLTVGDVAGELGLSAGYFSRLFRRTAGLTFTDYVNRARIDRVCLLLAETDRGVAEIGLACGFGSVPQFNRTFRRHTGFTPTEFRRRAADGASTIPAADSDQGMEQLGGA